MPWLGPQTPDLSVIVFMILPTKLTERQRQSIAPSAASDNVCDVRSLTLSRHRSGATLQRSVR
jgi:hypothetical protein